MLTANLIRALLLLDQHMRGCKMFEPTIAHITDEDGNVYQVLNEDGTDWDEEATRALYEDR